MGIKQATEAILGCMRSAVQREDKFRIDVQVDDATSSSPAGAVVSRTSYVLPARRAEHMLQSKQGCVNPETVIERIFLYIYSPSHLHSG